MPIPAPDALPLFPLGIVLYPGEAVPLHIFEERYRELVRYCLETEDPFGIVLTQDEKLASVGCTARIDRIIERYEDGRLDILVVGEERFRIEVVKRERLYLTAQVAPYEPSEGLVDRSARERLITLHMKLLELLDEPIRPAVYEGPKRISYVVAQNAGLDLSRKQEVLELPTEEERLSYLVGYLEELITRVRNARERRRKVQSNGHFKGEAEE